MKQSYTFHEKHGIPYKIKRNYDNISLLSYPYLFSCRCIHLTVDVCPYKVCIQTPLSASHTLSVRSVLPLMIVLPDICDDQTPPVCPTNVRKH